MSDFGNTAPRELQRGIAAASTYTSKLYQSQRVSAYHYKLLESSRYQNSFDLHHLRGMTWGFLQVSDYGYSFTY
jgi:hypothetical protein